MALMLRIDAFELIDADDIADRQRGTASIAETINRVASEKSLTGPSSSCAPIGIPRVTMTASTPTSAADTSSWLRALPR